MSNFRFYQHPGTNQSNYPSNRGNYRPRSGGYQNNYAEINPQYRAKKSGARMGVNDGGKRYVSAWNVSKKRGFMSMAAWPMTDAQLKAKSKLTKTDLEFQTTSKSGVVYERWTYKIQNKTTGEFFQGSAFFNAGSKKLYIPRFGMVASVNRNYFGKSHVSKNR